MLTKNASSKRCLMKYLLELPMAATLMLACNRYQVKPGEINITRDSALIKAIDAAAQKANVHYEPANLNENLVITRGTDHQSSFEPIPERVGVTFSQPE